eukprot:5195896-Pyramimonas_sp.AAC.1
MNEEGERIEERERWLLTGGRGSRSLALLGPLLGSGLRLGRRGHGFLRLHLSLLGPEKDLHLAGDSLDHWLDDMDEILEGHLSLR